MSKAQQIVKLADDLFATTERVNNENIWSEQAEFMLNNQHNFNHGNTTSGTSVSSTLSSTPGTKKTRRLYDSTALQAVQDLAAAFQGTLTNPATVWSKLRYQTDALNNDEWMPGEGS